MNEFVSLPRDKQLLKNLANDIINQKWPRHDDELGIFKFIFECNTFLRVFLLIGNFIYLNRIYRKAMNPSAAS